VELTRREFVKAGTYTVLGDTIIKKREASEYQIGAYYFPNFHVDPRNEQVHGKGWTEWEILKRGEPKFGGHQQPKQPAWGFADEATPSVFEKKIAAAQDAGVTHFIFDWYWYEGKPFLHRALEEGYLRAGNKGDVRFCIMWANHDWYNLMPARLDYQEKSFLYKGAYSADEFERVTDYILTRYFSDPHYLRIDGSPYFSIYELANLVDRMGGLEVARGAFERFRTKTRSAGFKDVHINAVAFGINSLPDPAAYLRALGVQSVTSYTWVHHFEMQSFPTVDYVSALQAAPAFWKEANEKFGVPYQPDVSMGWDPSPRTCQSDKFQHSDYPYTSILVNNTPELFQEALLKAKAYLDRLGNQPKVLNINSWNEWTEGSYLEPDSTHGMAYLNAIRKVFGS
jgi:Glycosyltransferase WbsX